MLDPSDVLDGCNPVAGPADTSEQLRRMSLRGYGLEGLAAGALNAELMQLTSLAQQVVSAQFAAVHILDGARQVRVAASAGTPVTVSRRSTSLCHQFLSNHNSNAALLTQDARTDPLLEDGRWMGSEDADVRFYAAAPLIGIEGVPLGALCAWSNSPAAATNARRLMLEELAQRVMGVLEERRTQDNPRTPAAAATRGSRPAPDQQPGAWTIDKVIAERAICTVFQPIIHLESGTVVGFEALTRGPQDSALESPTALLQAAETAGRLGELDWLCRVTAMQAAAGSGLHPSLAWFINVEPAGLDTPCPDHLLPEFAQANTDLRVVFEVVERGIARNAAKLLHVAESARHHAWGIALDDVGVVDGSLAMLSLLRPDVVKLDMAALLDADDRHAATGVISAVSAYAERTGAVILAEGIETEEHERMATVFAAQFGQGYRFGHPGPLPDTIPAPRHVVPLRQDFDVSGDTTPFEALSAHLTPRQAVGSEIAHIGVWLQERATTPDTPGVVLVNLPTPRPPQSLIQAHLRQIIDNNALTIVLAEDQYEVSEVSYRASPLPASNQMAGEWVVILLRPHFAAAFAARGCGGRSPGETRRFEYLVTHNRGLVTTAARAFLRGVDPDTDTAWLNRDFGLSGDAAAPESVTSADGNGTTTESQSSGSPRPSRVQWLPRRHARRAAPDTPGMAERSS